MKKLSYILFLSIIALCSSCGNDEPNYNRTDITRPKDGNGKVFIENGKLVEGNIDYTAEQLSNALANHEWTREYCIYYDNKTVSGKLQNANALPVTILPDKRMRYLYDGVRVDVREYEIKGKLLIASQPKYSTAGSIYPADEFIVVALDLNDKDGRIIMDYKLNREVTGYDINSLYVRMVWKTTPAQ